MNAPPRRHSRMTARSSRRRNQMSTSLQYPLLDSNSNNLLSNNPNYGTTLESPRGHVELMDAFIATPGVNNNTPPAPVSGSRIAGRIPSTTRGGSSPNYTPHHSTTTTAHSYGQHQPPAYSLMDTRRTSNVLEINKTPWSLLSHGLCCFQCVRTQEVGVTEDCGAFDTILPPGLHVMCWPISTIAGRLSVRVQQLDITCQTLTADRVFVHITVSLFFRVSTHRAYEAFYSLQNPRLIMTSGVLDAIQSVCPSLTLEELYSSKKQIADFCYERLGRHWLDHGYETNRILVQTIVPTSTVKDAMDEAAASRALKHAAAHTAEANKIEILKKAEGQAERHYLMGVALAKARQAMVHEMKQGAALLGGVDVRIAQPPRPKDIMNILLVAQYMDVLETVKPDSIMMEPEPQALNTIRERLPA